MHEQVFSGMKDNLKKYGKGKVLDVGSLQVKSRHNTFRELWGDYIGTDIVSGANVDVVCTETLPFTDNSFDTVISGNCFEHCENPFALIKEIERVLKPKGYFIGVAPRHWPDHHRPDCWRILPDGWNALIKYVKLTFVTTYVVDHSSENGRFADCWGIAQK